jgi:hypothetical protein
MPAFGTKITYRGYQLRSRTEFAWAQYFEGEGLSWRYEPHTFRNKRQSYTPDFFIPGVYIEIKVWGAKVHNRFHLCNEPLLLIFGLPKRCYIRFKPAGTERFNPGHVKAFRSAYALARKVAA